MWQKNVRYLDYNAGSGLTDFVRLKIQEIIKDQDSGGLFLANPSSRHRLGQIVQQKLRTAEQSVALSFGETVNPKNLKWFASGTQANRWVLEQASHDQAIIVGITEHSASYDWIAPLIQTGQCVKVLSVKPDGQYDLSALEKLIHEIKVSGRTKILLSLSWVNHETGVIQDLSGLKQFIESQKNFSIQLHLDAAQAWGKIEIDFEKTGADFITATAHKIGALPGTGLVWTKSFIPFSSGTPNVLGILSAGFAAQSLNVAEFQKQTVALQQRLEKKLESLPVQIYGNRSARITNTVRLSVKGFTKYENWVELLDLEGFAVSHGSACQSHLIQPSRVLLAMGAEECDALNSIRVSFGTQQNEQDVDDFFDALSGLIQKKLKV